jgi:hypothetical protein
LNIDEEFTKVAGMKWVVGVCILVLVGLLLRRLLHLGRPEVPVPKGLVPLAPEREGVYQSAAREIETQAAILGISLNDAIEESDAKHDDIAWRLVRLSICEWERLADTTTALLTVMSKHLDKVVHVAVPARSLAKHHFCSSTMIEYAQLHEVLDQMVVSSKLRIQLHLRLLRGAIETLTGEVQRNYRHAEQTQDHSPQVWTQLDLTFHDFDLVTKETLLAYRGLVVCLPQPALGPFGTDVVAVVKRSVRETAITAEWS